MEIKMIITINTCIYTYSLYTIHTCNIYIYIYIYILLIS